jgi:hypothetical protein
LQWQRTEEPHGNPWVAIVIDPLRSLYQGKPGIQKKLTKSIVYFNFLID